MSAPEDRRAPTDRVPAPLLVLVAIASVQLGSAVARTVFDEVGANGITLLRLGISALFLVLVVRPRVRRWSRQQVGSAVLLGLTMGAMNIVFYLSIRTVPLGVAVTVEFIGPLLVALVQSRRFRDFVFVLLAAAGVVLLGVDGGSDVPIGGLALALLAGLFWGGYILASARVGRLVPGMDGLAVALVVSAALALPFGAEGAMGAFGDPMLLMAGVAVALLSSVVPYGLELAALRRIPTRVFGILMSLEPAAAALAGLVVLGQQLAPRELVALVLVSVASLGVTLARREGQPPVAPLE
ncbi:MAG: EamA family transporter [Spirochaetaceae bacterium]|nr:EamA family transporter [Spirochaetaceae bacterium]